MARMALILVAGVLFGVGLAVSGMTDPARVIGFLDLFGKWDPALAFVMGGALGTYAIAMVVMRVAGKGKGWFGTVLPKGGSDPVSFRLVGGAVIFGVGWGLGGFCPGPALADLGGLRLAALVFVPTMAIGMLAAQRLAGADRG